MNYLSRAVELSKISLDAGEFPAGAVLVTKNGGVYESKPSVPHNHGECMVVDDAVQAEGHPLTGAVMYASMQPCLMCSSKMYWAGVEQVEYAIPKQAVNMEYAYENNEDTEKITSSFWKPLHMQHISDLQEEALTIYKLWVSRL